MFNFKQNLIKLFILKYFKENYKHLKILINGIFDNIKHFLKFEKTFLA